MNKLFPIVIILLIILGGGFYLFSQSKKGQPSPKTPSQKGQTQKGDIFSSIKDALSKSLSLECTYKDEKGIETKTYVKAGAVRVDAKSIKAGSEANSQIIFKDHKMYSWDPATKKGVLFEIPEENLKTTPSVNQPSGDNKGENFLAEIEKYKNSCKSAAVSDSLFVPPSDVDFQDLSKMMENVNKPNSEAAPTIDIEQLKKQYSPEGQ